MQTTCKDDVLFFSESYKKKLRVCLLDKRRAETLQGQ